MAVNLVPTFAEEEKLIAQGYLLIAGVDEVGRGALAGPVMAGAVILPLNLKAPWLDEVRDSKLLTPEKREILAEYINEAAIATGLGLVTNTVIDKKGISKASRLAMKQAIQNLQPQPDFLLIDYFKLPEVRLKQKGVEEGDTLCLSIACASIIAKVARDKLMVELDGDYPGYGLAQHKGYCTPGHLACLAKLGPTPIHRHTWTPVSGLL